MRFFNIGIVELIIISVVGGLVCFPYISLAIVLIGKMLSIRMRGDHSPEKKK